MATHISRLIGNTCAAKLFPETPTIHFVPEVSMCCSSDLQVQKTRTKTVATLTIGEFYAKETIFVCRECGKVYIPSELPTIVPPLCKFGYDTIVHVGKAALLLCQSDEQIMGDLWAKNISISLSEITYLQKKFIVYLALIHNESSQRIRESIEARGGYILHLNGTCDGDSPFLMSGLDEISGFVLHNVKIPSESAERILPFLEKIKKKYGSPVAIVSDMGKGIANAIKEVFPEVPHFLCHFHFLRDIGKDLLSKENDLIRSRLRKHKINSKLLKYAHALKQNIDSNPELAGAYHSDVEGGQLSNCALEFAPLVSTYLLICWALEGKKQGRGYGFPFDLTYVTFAERLRVLYDHLEKLVDIRLRNEWRDNRPFFKTRLDLKKVISDKVLWQAITDIKSKRDVFDRFRDAMRITVDNQHRGLNDDGQVVDIKTIKEGVEAFRCWLSNDSCYSPDNDYGKMITQIDKYWESPITIDTPYGKVTFQPQRTNNILERFFREIKRDHRRKSGTSSMSKKLKAMLADTPLVKNIENKEYVKIILNGKATLEERFAEIDAKSVREELRKSQEHSEAIPAKLREIIKKSDLPQIVMKLFVRGVAA